MNSEQLEQIITSYSDMLYRIALVQTGSRGYGSTDISEAAGASGRVGGFKSSESMADQSVRQPM